MQTLKISSSLFYQVWTDTDRLTQILYNLMYNAAKYSPQEVPVVILAKVADSGKQAVTVIRGLKNLFKSESD